MSTQLVTVKLTHSSGEIIRTRLHLPENSLRLNISSCRSRNLRLLFGFLEPNLLKATVDVEAVITPFIVKVRLVAMELLCRLLRFCRKVFQRGPNSEGVVANGLQGG
jgi:hypothetical protein